MELSLNDIEIIIQLQRYIIGSDNNKANELHRQRVNGVVCIFNQFKEIFTMSKEETYLLLLLNKASFLAIAHAATNKNTKARLSKLTEICKFSSKQRRATKVMSLYSIDSLFASEIICTM